MLNTLRNEHAAIIDYYYLDIPIWRVVPNALAPNSLIIDEATDQDRNSVEDFILINQGIVYLQAEFHSNNAFTDEDVNAVYQQCGLFRYRRVLLCRAAGEILGVAIINRSSLGMNFSFLENRVDLIIDNLLSNHRRQQVLTKLIHSTIEFYRDFPPQSLFVTITDGRGKEFLENSFYGTHIRTYSQSIWLRPAFTGFYAHIDNMYQRALKRIAKNNDTVRRGIA
jgi:hypothetical protein